MSLNTAHAHGGVLIHAGESIMLFSDGVQIEFVGQDGEAFRGAKTGRLYLTTHRMIFANKKLNDPLVSFSFPFTLLQDIEVEQPIFGANFIKGKVRAQPQGNWVGEVKFKISFKKGGAIDFASAMSRAVSMAKSHSTDEPPPYTSPAGPMYQAPPPAYTPSQNGYYGWMPPMHAFPDAPPANSVYMTDMPPPYPGIGGYTGYAAPPTTSNGPIGFNVGPMSSADAKAAEAAQTAYYDPNRPNTAYVPPPAYYEAPPSYQDSNKKYQ